jgi:DNA-binding MarR family transcriptional regulator
VRTASATDRRCITLTLTSEGRAQLEAAVHNAQVSLAAELEKLPDDQRTMVVQAMQLLRSVFVTCSENSPKFQVLSHKSDRATLD